MFRVLRARDERSIVAWLGVGSAAVLLLLQQGAITHIDGQSIYEVTRSIVSDGDFSVDPSQHLGGAVTAPDGELYSKYGIGLSLVALVPYLIVLPVANAGGGDVLLEAAVASIMPIICALLVLAVYALARRLRAGIGASLLVAIGTVAGTFLLSYTGEFFSEPPAALGLVVAIERALARRSGQAAAALALAALFRPQVFVFAPVLVFFLLRREGRASLRASVPPLAIAAAATLAYNYARFGNIFESGYQANDEGFTADFLPGVHGLLLSVDKSIFLFAPVFAIVPFALVRLWRHQRPAAVLIGLNLAVTFVLAATWTAWHGDWAWGARLLLPGLPAAFCALAPWLEQSRPRRQLVVALFAVGFIVNLPALIASTDAQQLDRGANGHSPRSPGIVRQFELVPKSVDYSASHLGGGESGDHRRYVDLWQVGLGRDKGEKGILAAVPPSLFLLALAGISFIAVRRRTRGR